MRISSSIQQINVAGPPANGDFFLKRWILIRRGMHFWTYNNSHVVDELILIWTKKKIHQELDVAATGAIVRECGGFSGKWRRQQQAFLNVLRRADSETGKGFSFLPALLVYISYTIRLGRW
jgi:hypothetical protein